MGDEIKESRNPFASRPERPSVAREVSGKAVVEEVPQIVGDVELMPPVKAPKGAKDTVKPGVEPEL